MEENTTQEADSKHDKIPPKYAGELRAVLEEYASKYQSDNTEDGLDSMLRVRGFARYANITLANSSAAQEALGYVKNINVGRYYILWLDLSVCKNHARAQKHIVDYVQAMRTAVSRLRQLVKQAGQSRSFRNWGISIVESIELTECPGLWRVVLDNRRNLTRERFVRMLADTDVYDGLTVAGTDNKHGGSEIEQEAELRRRGINV